jgi:hypothetical protein
MEKAYTLVAWITSTYDGTSIHPCGMEYLLLRWNKHTPLWHGLPPLTMEQAYTLVAWITSSYDGTSIHPCGMNYLLLSFCLCSLFSITNII